MEQIENHYLASKGTSIKISEKMTDNVIKINKCNQCEYVFSRAGDLRKHLKMHRGEKSNKWIQLHEL